MKTSNVILCFSILAVLSSCKKENNHHATLSYKLRTGNSAVPINARMAAGNVQWTAGYASVAEIEFEAAKEGLEVEYKQEAKKEVDLFSTLASLGVVSVPAGVYEDVEFEVEVQPNGERDAFQLSGTFSNSNSVITPVLFRVNTAIEIESERENITLADGNNITALNILNLSLATTGVSEAMLNNATLTNGKIEISATSNTDIYNIMFSNLKACGGVEIED